MNIFKIFKKVQYKNIFKILILINNLNFLIIQKFKFDYIYLLIMDDSKCKIIMLCGYLGSGKTTLI